uniref:Secreted protein n=1 Tax=Oryza punctata TaxID=4537 RepID=A0A0E0LGG3_ORYPU
MAAAAAQRLAVFLNIILGSEICGSCTGRTHQLIVVGGRRMSTSPGNNKEVLYPTELSNLMATFIRIGDDFHVSIFF